MPRINPVVAANAGVVQKRKNAATSAARERIMGLLLKWAVT
jgi:hypothetical protein